MLLENINFECFTGRRASKIKAKYERIRTYITHLLSTDMSSHMETYHC